VPRRRTAGSSSTKQEAVRDPRDRVNGSGRPRTIGKARRRNSAPKAASHDGRRRYVSRCRPRSLRSGGRTGGGIHRARSRRRRGGLVFDAVTAGRRRAAWNVFSSIRPTSAELCRADERTGKGAAGDEEGRSFGAARRTAGARRHRGQNALSHRGSFQKSRRRYRGCHDKLDGTAARRGILVALAAKFKLPVAFHRRRRERRGPGAFSATRFSPAPLRTGLAVA